MAARRSASAHRKRPCLGARAQRPDDGGAISASARCSRRKKISSAACWPSGPALTDPERPALVGLKPVDPRPAAARRRAFPAARRRGDRGKRRRLYDLRRLFAACRLLDRPRPPQARRGAHRRICPRLRSGPQRRCRGRSRLSRSSSIPKGNGCMSEVLEFRSPCAGALKDIGPAAARGRQSCANVRRRPRPSSRGFRRRIRRSASKGLLVLNSSPGSKTSSGGDLVFVATGPRAWLAFSDGADKPCQLRCVKALGETAADHGSIERLRGFCGSPIQMRGPPSKKVLASICIRAPSSLAMPPRPPARISMSSSGRSTMHRSMTSPSRAVSRALSAIG